MKARLMIAGLFCACTASAAESGIVDTLGKIKANNVVTLGVREATAFSFALGDGKYAGFHYDVCANIVQDLKKLLAAPNLQTHYQVVTSQNRIPLIQNGTVDLECGATTNNSARQRDVAFATTTYVEEVRIAVAANSSITSLQDLEGKTVVTTTGTTAVKTLRRLARSGGIDFDLIYGKDHSESFLLLEQGRADAYIIDQSTLAALIAKARYPSNFKIVGKALSVEPIAIAIPKGDAAFSQAVNASIAAQANAGTLEALWNKWFLQPIPPEQININFPLSQATRDAWSHPNDKPAEAYSVTP